MTIEEILTQSIRIEIDKQILMELGELAGADFTEQIKDMEKKYQTMLDRKLGKLSNKDIHETTDL